MRKTLGRFAVHGSLVLTLVIPFAARAAGEGEIRNYILSISRLYDGLEYERALSRIQLARQVPRGTEDEVALSLYEGIILYEMGKQEAGTSAFKSALFLRPDAKLPEQVAPKIENLFESVRKQVKSEMDSLLVPREPQSPSDKTGPDEEKREDKSPSPSPKKDESSRMEPRDSTSQAVEPGMKAESEPPAPDSPKVAQTHGAPAAAQSLENPDCGPKPASVSSRDPKELLSWRLASVKHALCLVGGFQGLAAERWTDLKSRMEAATTSPERARIGQDIDQFAREFIYVNPRWRALSGAETKEAESRDAEKKQMPDGVDDPERLMQRLVRLQEKFLRGNSPSKHVPIRELDKIGQKIQAARTSEMLKEAEHALDSWQQRYLPQDEAPLPNAEPTRRAEESDRSPMEGKQESSAHREQMPDGVDKPEWLMQRLIRLREKFLIRRNSSSTRVPLRELDKIGQKIQAARTSEMQKEAEHALASWEELYLPQ